MFVSKRVFQVVFIAFAIYGAYLASGDFDVFDAAGYFPPGIVRLRVLELQNGGNSSDVALIAAGLISNVYLSIKTIKLSLSNSKIVQLQSDKIFATACRPYVSNCQQYDQFMFIFFLYQNSLFPYIN